MLKCILMSSVGERTHVSPHDMMDASNMPLVCRDLVCAGLKAAWDDLNIYTSPIGTVVRAMGPLSINCL